MVKKTKVLGIITFSILIFQFSNAQNYTINGYVKDISNGEVLIGANIFVKGTTIGTVTNVYGFYSLTLPQGNYYIVYSYMGYDINEIEVVLDEEKKINIELPETVREIEEVIITAQQRNENIVNTKMSTVKLNSITIKKIPVLLGEADVIRSLQLLPGVKSTGEMSSGLSIRGGARDQNLILLDEAAVYNASHLLGIFSVFNSDAIKSVELYKGNIPAEYGGRLSSLIDIRMKEGNAKRFSGTGGIGLLSSRITIEAPIVKDKGSFIVSGRRTYFDLVMKMLHNMNDTIPELPVYFYDLNIKGNYELSDKHRLYVSGYFGRDVASLSISDDISEKFHWGNYTGTFRWNYIINKKIFSNVTFLVSNYDYRIESKFKLGDDDRTFSMDWKAYLKDYSVKADLGYYINPSNTLKFGFISTYHDFNTGDVKGISDTIPFVYKIPKIYCLEHAVYTENEQKIADNLILNYGLRFSILQNIGTATIYELEDYTVVNEIRHTDRKVYNSYYGLEPRIHLAYILSDLHSVKFGYARTMQYLQVASNSTTGTPIDVWIPSGNNLKPQISDQISAGYFRNFLNNNIKTSVEVYYKYMDNLVDFVEFAEPFFNPEIEEELRFGVGKAYGMELLIEKQQGKLTGWVSYTLSRAERKIRDIQEKDWFLSPYDTPHDFSIYLSYLISERFTLSANWVFQTGSPLTAPDARWEYGNLTLPFFTGRNDDRLPSYHRLDIGAEFRLNKKANQKFEHSINISVYNAYNRKNANLIRFEQDNTNAYRTRAMRTSLLPIFPSVTWNFKF